MNDRRSLTAWLPMYSVAQRYAEFCRASTTYAADSSISSSLNYRLRNLVDRRLIAKSGHTYQVTHRGLDYLGRHGSVSNRDTPNSTIAKFAKANNTAVRGTNITTGGFTKGTVDAAFLHGAPPITLIDGERLIDLLIEHNIGIRRREVRILEFDAESLSQFESEPEPDL